MVQLYGIKNCNTVKKALDWLEKNQVDYQFHDFKKEGASEEKLLEWTGKAGWENLLNRKGTTWRQLDDAEKEKITGREEAIRLMQEKTSVIKRPVIENNGNIILGFDEEEYIRLKKA